MPSRAVPQLVVFGLVALALVVATLRDPRGLRRRLALREEVLGLEARNASLSRENQLLMREVDALGHDPRYLERAIREELGYVRPGEIVLELDAPETAEGGAR
ncbi:MAG: FtsB family cell division protein [Deltaproteobacteria bacterium]